MIFFCFVQFATFPEGEITTVRVGVFTALLAQMPLDQVIEKLKKLNIDTVELGTGNYPGDPHCKLSMLDNVRTEGVQKEARRQRLHHQRAELPRQRRCTPTRPSAKAHAGVNRKTILLAEKLGVPVVIDFSGCPGDQRQGAKYPNWVTCPWPPDYLELLEVAVGEEGAALLERARQVRRRPRREDRHRDAPRLRGLQPGNDAALRRRCGPNGRLQLTTPATCSGRASTPSPPSACSATASSTSTPRTPRSTTATCPSPACSTPRSYTDERNRAWIFRTVRLRPRARSGGSEFISTLRMYGYDYASRSSTRTASCPPTRASPRQCFFETADAYTGMPQMLGVALKGLPRDSYKLMTKFRLRDTSDPKGTIDRFRKEMQTDYFDILLMHCVRSATWPTDLESLQDELSEAKHKKIILSKGASVHGLLPLRAFPGNKWLDVALLRTNHSGARMDTLQTRDTNDLGDVNEVVSHAKKIHAQGTGVLGMKLIGEGQFTKPEDREAAFRFVMKLGVVDSVTVGFKNTAEIDEAIERMNRALNA
jgi:1-deoxyxylulose-5-phosphate synthase